MYRHLLLRFTHLSQLRKFPADLPSLLLYQKDIPSRNELSSHNIKIHCLVEPEAFKWKIIKNWWPRAPDEMSLKFRMARNFAGEMNRNVISKRKHLLKVTILL